MQEEMTNKVYFLPEYPRIFNFPLISYYIWI